MFYTVPKNNERRLSLQALFPILENGWLTKKGKGKTPPPRILMLRACVGAHNVECIILK